MIRHLLVIATLLGACAGSGRPSNPNEDLASNVTDAATVDLKLSTTDLAPIGDLAGVCGVTRLVINEVKLGGFDPTDEWIELYNPCPNAVGIDGATLKYRTPNAVSDTRDLVALAGTIAAGGYHVIAGTGYAGTRQQSFIATGDQLTDTGGAIGLRAPNNVLVDGFGWGAANNIFVETAAKPAPLPSDSVGRVPNGRDTNNNETDFGYLQPPTPGARN